MPYALGPRACITKQIIAVMRIQCHYECTLRTQRTHAAPRASAAGSPKSEIRKSNRVRRHWQELRTTYYVHFRSNVGVDNIALGTGTGTGTGTGR